MGLRFGREKKWREESLVFTVFFLLRVFVIFRRGYLEIEKCSRVFGSFIGLGEYKWEF